jgi:uncharacterized protein
MDVLRRVLFDLSVEGRFALAYSGGLDSRFLAHAARDFGLRPLLLHISGPHIPERESAYARCWAGEQGLEFRELPLNPLHDPKVKAGDIRRCYYCKYSLFRHLTQEAKGLPLCDGTHASDAQGYRPGLLALQELGVHSPLADAGLDKPDIRALGAATNMGNTDQRPRPCLLTRLNYGLAPSPDLLHSLDLGEQYVDTLFSAPFAGQEHKPDFRLRLVAPDRIELHLEDQQGFTLSPQARQTLTDGLKQRGIFLREIRLMPSLSGFFDQNNA